jgi:hypothetical protein
MNLSASYPVRPMWTAMGRADRIRHHEHFHSPFRLPCRRRHRLGPHLLVCLAKPPELGGLSAVPIDAVTTIAAIVAAIFISVLHIPSRH